MSKTMSTLCSISIEQLELPSSHVGRTSIAIVWNEASNSLCPSSKLDTPALPLQGSNLRKGVRFSVQTTSWGSVPWRRWRLEELPCWPSGSNDMTGRIVLVASIKLIEAQKRPDRALVSFNHRANALGQSVWVLCPFDAIHILFFSVSLYPRPQLNTSASFSCAVPWPLSPILGIPTSNTEP